MSNARAVKVGYNPDFAPFSYSDEGGIRGLVVERLRQIFEAAGIPLTLTAVALPQMQGELAAGRVDALAAVASIPRRHGLLALSQTIVMSGGAWFVAKSSDWPSDPELLVERVPPWRAITPASGPLVAQIEEQFPLLKLQTCADYDAALHSVLAENSDAAALNWHVGTQLIARDYPVHLRAAGSPFCRLPLALATRANDPYALLPRLNRHIPEEWALPTAP